jgi:hypothetical protein
VRAHVDPFAYSRSGQILAGADLNAVTAYAGADEKRLWRAEAQAQVVALAASAREVVAVDGAGAIERWSAIDGSLVRCSRLEAHRAARATPRAAAMHDDGACAVALADRVGVEQRGRVSYFAAQGVVDVDFREDGMALALGLETGEVRVVDLMGHVVAATRFEEAIDGLCWSAAGLWLVSAGGRMVAWDGLHQDVRVARRSGEPLRSPTCSRSGAVVAFRVGSSEVRVHDAATGVSVGSVEYHDRPVGSVQFGPALWLAIGLDRGEGNRVDLATSAVHRTEPTPDQARSSWSVQVRLRTEVAIAAEGGRDAAPGAAEPPPATRSVDRARPGLRQRPEGLTLCCGCGDPKDTVVCPQCGAVNGDPADREAERAALDDLHEAIGRSGAAATCRLLRDGWVPTDREALLEAARRTLPFLGDPPRRPLDDLGDAAAARLQTIVERLKKAKQTPAVFKTILDLERRVREARAPVRRGRTWLAVVALLVAAAAAAIVAALLAR